MRDAPAGSNQFQKTLERIPARQREHGVDAIRRKRANLLDSVLIGGIDDHVSAEFTHELPGFRRARGANHLRVVAFRELHRERPDRAGRAKD